MKKAFLTIFLSLGWVACLLLLASGYLMNKFDDSSSVFKPISWGEHMKVVSGAISCSLTSDELMERKQELQEKIFPKVKRKEELADGFIYFFDDEDQLAEDIMEFMAKEKQCCPFFQFDMSILPFEQGLAFKISGSEQAKEFLISMGIE